jgi:hypothetical protein
MITLTVTLGAVATAVHAIDLPALTDRANAVAVTASCRSVALGILAYVGEHDTPPTRVEELRPYVEGDLTAYRIEGGAVRGPGCRTA